ncbi:MAG: zf-HC2 domain-containing protein [Ilumatobacteraceae bacterium]
MATDRPHDQPTTDGTTVADCVETLRALEAFLDRELSTESVSHVRAHLDGCVDCQGAYEFHAELRTVVRSKCLSDDLPDGLADRLRACLGDAVLNPTDD